MDGFGITLAGGGARGAYEIGAWKALRELNIPIVAVSGTSVGALNGAIMVQGDYESAYNFWTNISYKDVIKVESEINIPGKAQKRSIMLRTVKDAIASGGLDITPLKLLLEGLIDEERIRKSSIDFGIVTFSLTDFKPLRLFKEDIPKGRMVDYLLASACFPAFKTQKIDNKKYIDGGVYDNIPVSMLIEKSIRNIIEVDISGPGIARRVDTRGVSIIHIKNTMGLGGVLDFNSERSIRNIEAGYLDTLKSFGKLKGCRYYIMPSGGHMKNEEKYTGSVGINDLKNMYRFLGVEWNGKPDLNRRLLVERIMGTINRYSDGKLTVHAILPAMAEITAEQIGISRDRVYSLNELIDLILQEYDRIKNSNEFAEYIKTMNGFIFSRDQAEFDRDIKKLLIRRKFMVFYDPDLYEDDMRVKMFRRFIAMTFPKVSVANMLISLMNLRDECREEQQ